MVVEFRADVPSAIEFRGYKPSDEPVAITVIPQTTSSGGTTVDRTTKDGMWSDYTGAVEKKEAQVTVTEIGAAFSAVDPSIVDVNPTTGFCAYKGVNGTTGIVAQCRRVGVRANVSVSQTSGQSSTAFKNYVVGSLAKIINDAFDAALALPPSGNLNLFSSYQAPTKCVWNTNNWAYVYGVKLWPICCYKGSNEPVNWGGATAVHPRFAAVADHYYLDYQPGRVLGWNTQANTFITRTIVSYHAVAGDLGIVELDSDLPIEIGFARVLPDNWQTKLASIYYGALGGTITDVGVVVPAMWRNRNSDCGCLEWYLNILNGVSWFCDSCNYQVPAHPNRFAYHLNPSSGDSGNGVCLIHPQTKDLIFMAAQLNGYGGTSIVNYKVETNAWMNSRVPGAALTDADFSMYPTY